jgi:hypothetical protein
MKLIANGFVTDIPEGWEDRSMITLVGPGGADDFAPNVVVMRERIEAGADVADYARRQRAMTEREIPDLQVLDERLTTVGGAPAFQRLQRFDAGGRRLQQAQVYVLTGHTAFVLTCTATLEQFDEQIPHFRRVVDSFRLFDPQNVRL